MVKDNEKLGILQRELQLVNEKRAIVFVNTKKSCDIVSRHLDALEYACTVLHGGKTQVRAPRNPNSPEITNIIFL